MYEVKNVIHNVHDIPAEWIYRKYYKLAISSNYSIDQPFDGRSIRVKSPFSRDSNPSMFFFYKNGRYLWKDFSTGSGGDILDFVSKILNKSRPSVEGIIISSYEMFLEGGGIHHEQEVTSIAVNRYKADITAYNEDDIKWWGRFGITTDILSDFKVRKISTYSLYKDSKLTFSASRSSLFAFENNNGVYQIYRPDMVPKYLYNDCRYLIGYEQLKFKSDTCGILSGLKDIMAMTSLGLNIEYVAPPSETVMLSEDKIDMLRSFYNNIFVLFDNDSSGITAMKKYKKIYDIEPVRIDLEKDIADNNLTHEDEFLKSFYSIKINKAINK